MAYHKLIPDVFCSSPSGSGKTLAFLVPLLQKVIEDVAATPHRRQFDIQACCEPLALIISPTRELATQTHRLLVDLTKYTPDVQPVALYGGIPRKINAQQLAKGGEILCCTAGRLMDMVATYPVLLHLGEVRVVVFDEGDYWMDDKWETPIEEILDTVNDNCALWFFTAEITEEHKASLKENYLPNASTANTIPPIIIEYSDEMIERPEDFVRVHFDVVNAKREEKLHCLEDHFFKKFPTPCKTLVLAQRLDDVERINGYIVRDMGIRPVVASSADHPQYEREMAIRRFAAKSALIFITSIHIGKLGLTFANTERLILYDVPKDIGTLLTFVARVGRSGPAGLGGSLHILFDEDRDMAMAAPLRKLLLLSNQEVPDWLQDLAERNRLPNDRNDEEANDKNASLADAPTLDQTATASPTTAVATAATNQMEHPSDKDSNDKSPANASTTDQNRATLLTAAVATVATNQMEHPSDKDSNDRPLANASTTDQNRAALLIAAVATAATNQMEHPSDEDSNEQPLAGALTPSGTAAACPITTVATTATNETNRREETRRARLSWLGALQLRSWMQGVSKK